MQTIQLTHYYSLLRGFFAVRTQMCLEDLNLACAYLQLLRYRLPAFLEIVEDGLGEIEAVSLLSRLYGCVPIVSETPFPPIDGNIDLYDNWEDYAISPVKQTAINKLARPGARLAILDEMLKDARREINRQPTDQQIEIIEKLEAIKSGALVTSDWELKTLGKDIYSGKIVITIEPDLFLFVSEFRSSLFDHT